jgi:hypothetical protein
MRQAAGTMLIILGIVGLIGLIVSLSGSGIYLSSLPFMLWRIVSGAFLVTGGIFCLKRKYWGLCLASALLALVIGIFSTIDMLRYMGTSGMGPFWEGGISLAWGTWIMALGAVVSTVFISLAKEEWHKSQA